MYKWIVIVLLASPVSVFSQPKKKTTKPGFQSSAGFAVLVGQNEPAWQGQLTTGLKMNDWFTGIGVGLDDYRFRNIPLFLTARRDDLFHSSFFAYADAGIAFPWNRELQNDEGMFSEQQKFYTGFYSETGIGYRLPSKKRISLRFSAGYSFRTMKQKVIHPMWWSSLWPPPMNEITYHHRFHLLTARATVCFNHRK